MTRAAGDYGLPRRQPSQSASLTAPPEGEPSPRNDYVFYFTPFVGDGVPDVPFAANLKFSHHRRAGACLPPSARIGRTET